MHRSPLSQPGSKRRQARGSHSVFSGFRKDLQRTVKKMMPDSLAYLEQRQPCQLHEGFGPRRPCRLRRRGNQIRGNQSRPPTTSDQITTSRLENRSLQNGAFQPAQFGLNSGGESVSRPLRGCEMIGKLTEPKLTRRLALLAEARRDDPSVSQHLIEAEIERLQAALLGIAKTPREPPAAHFMRDIAYAALRPELRDATG